MYDVLIKFKDPRLKEILKLSDYIGKRSSSNTNENKIIIKAKDATALRATIDGYMKALKIFEKTLKLKNEYY